MFTSTGFRQHITIVFSLAALILSGCGGSTPTISSFSPSSGTAGTSVTITGGNFSTTAASNSVAFNGTSATVTSATITEIVATVPSGATTGRISVTVNNLTATSSSDFTVTPSITSFSPASGSVGTTVTIAGTGFDTAKANDVVKFNGVTATVTSATSTEIVATVPSGAATGQITITVDGQSAISSSIFTVD
jgi:hypothetical protein